MEGNALKPKEILALPRRGYVSWEAVKWKVFLVHQRRLAIDHLAKVVSEAECRLFGCCTNCHGKGTDMGAPETNGKCWDCYGTGHTHA